MWESLCILCTNIWNRITGNKISAELSDTRHVEVGTVTEENKKKNNKIKTSKYSIINFLPKNLAEQFRRVANFYFLVVTVIALLIDSPVSPMTSVVPLMFMVFVTMVKQGYEDWLRHKADNVVNLQTVEVLRNDILQKVRSADVAPGILVRVQRGRDVPADLVLLCSSDERGKCYVTTANLDGETNLKTLRVPPPLIGYSPDRLPTGLRLEIPDPVADLYTFYGRLDIAGRDSVPLSTDNIMLRGSRVKNTEWAIGCAVYTGEETKLALNSRYMSNKFTSCEAAINGFLLFFIIILVIEVMLSYFFKRHIEKVSENHEAYLGPNEDISVASAMQDMLSFLLLYYYIIPISLYVTLELYKFIGSSFIGWDPDLIDPETGQEALANTSDLNEELGQIEILFSDKTGTLTKNEMVFKMCSINGAIYEERDGKLYDSTSWDEPENIFKTDIKFFFTVLALCHSVQISNEDQRQLSARLSVNRDLMGMFKIKKPREPINNLTDNDLNENTLELQYQASSPDEKALVEAAVRAGVTFMGEDGNSMILSVGGTTTEYYERLQMLEFTSERKRMSIVLKDKDGKIWLFCKGAESSVLPLCIDDPLIEATNKHIDLFATKGLRTLAIACREIPQEEYDKVTKDFTRTRSAISGSSGGTVALKELSQQYRNLEQGMKLIGSTAVEDCLQDDVADTLSALRRAGIKIWVLTGDKVETAINVAQSCAHIPDDDQKMFLVNIENAESLELQLQECRKTINTSEDKMLTMVVDGLSMAQILGKQVEDVFVEISLHCAAVLCCRLSPIQKAMIVKLIKNSPGNPITAAIGDGANDISMIQEAHVGFGIFGKEGRQAARSSDFAFKKFCMIRKFLIVLGNWYYQRFATLILYFFYKNLAFVNLMIFFQIHSQFSTQSIFDSLYLTCFNLVFASLPCLVHSVTEQNRSANTLIKEPIWYKKNRKNKLLSWGHFSVWCSFAIYHSVVIYVMCWLAIKQSIISIDGKPVDLWCLGAALFHLLVVVVNFKLWLQTRYNTVPFVISIAISIFSFVAINSVYSALNLGIDGDVLGTYSRMLSSSAFWFLQALFVVIALLPDFLARLVHDELRKRKHHLQLQAEAERNNNHHDTRL